MNYESISIEIIKRFGWLICGILAFYLLIIGEYLNAFIFTIFFWGLTFFWIIRPLIKSKKKKSGGKNVKTNKD